MRLASIELPDEDIESVEISSGKFIYRPVKSEEWSVEASLQRRNFIAIRVTEDGRGEIIGPVVQHHAFRELFDFIPEGDELPALNEENFDEILARLMSKAADEDVDSIVLPPTLSFSYANLPFSPRELRTTIKTRAAAARASRSTERSWNVSYGVEEVPIEPSSEAVMRAKNVPAAHIELVRHLFFERPVMSKAFLESKISDPAIIANLKLILPSIAYHWKNGPWHLLWTRYGIDPRASPEYKQFQSIELRNRMFAKELRRGHSSNQQQLQPKSTTTTTMSTSSANFCFDGKELTLNCLTYQICDLTYPPLAQIVNNPSNVKTYVTERDGWFVDGTVKRLRDLMKIRWFELIKSADLSGLPLEKLEEILQVIAPHTGRNALPGTINQIISQLEAIESGTEEETEEAEGGQFGASRIPLELEPESESDSESDYEIYE